MGFVLLVKADRKPEISKLFFKKDMTMKPLIIHIVLALLLCIAPASAQQYHLLQTITGTGGGSHATSSGDGL